MEFDINHVEERNRGDTGRLCRPDELESQEFIFSVGTNGIFSNDKRTPPSEHQIPGDVKGEEK